MHIVSALFVENFEMRQAPGPSTRIDLTGAMFSMAAPSPAPVTLTPHLVALIYCPPDESGQGVFEVIFRSDRRPRVGDRAGRPQRQPVQRRARQVHLPARARRARVPRLRHGVRPLPDRPRRLAPRAVHAAATRRLTHPGVARQGAGYSRSDAHVAVARSDPAGHLAHPRLGDGRPAQGEQRPPGHGDGARAARPRALQPDHEARSGRSRVARPRPVRAVQRARVDPAVLDAVPLRLRPRARRHQGVPPVGVADTRPSRGPPHRRRRGHHRPARPGLRQRRRHGDRRALPARPLRHGGDRPPHVRDRRRRLLHGGRQPRGGLARRSPRARQADLRLRRQPHHDRRRHDARVQRRHRRALRAPTAGTSVELGEMANDLDGLDRGAPGGQGRRPTGPTC